MAELSALLDQLTLLVRHLIVAVKEAPATYDRLAFMGAIQALGSALDSIDGHSSALEAKETILSTRAFAHAMITLVAAKQGQGDVDSSLQTFLGSAKHVRPSWTLPGVVAFAPSCPLLSLDGNFFLL